MTPALQARQSGAATLLLVLGLVLLATLGSAYSSRAVLADLLASQGMARAAQARLAAQAALATAEAALLQPGVGGTGQNPFEAAQAPCPPPLQGAQWQCAPLPLPQPPDSEWRWSATLVRDLIESPHVWQIHANASGKGTQAWVRRSVFMPVLAPAPADAPQAALVLNGCASPAPGSHWQICPSTAGTPCSGAATGPAVYSHFVPDTDHNGRIDPSERAACLALAPSLLPAGGRLDSPSSPTPRSPCNRAAWRSVLGDNTPEQVRAWSQAQERQGLHSLSQPARNIYWVDSPADWTQSLGSANQPVLLVFSSQACALRCPRLAAGTTVQGTVVLEAGCDDEKMRGWQAGQVQGQLVVEGGLPQFTGSARLLARPQAHQAYTLHWPPGMATDQVQGVNGSRLEGSP